MKLTLIVGLLGLAFCADNNIQGPGNIVHHGKHNSIRGKHNSVDGFVNKLNGKLNNVKGDKNLIHGNNNFVHGDKNLILGNGNIVNSGKEVEVDSDIDEEPSFEKKHSWTYELQEELENSFGNIEEEVKELTEGMRKKFVEKFEHKFTESMKKQFQDSFHSQSKLKHLNLEKLKNMKPGNQRL